MSADIWHIDFETRSRAPIRRCGAEVYAMHESTEVLCLAYAPGPGPVQVTVGEYLADDLRQHVESGGTVGAHNAHFELWIWRMMTERHGWPVLRASQMVDTMAQARMCGFPGGLDECAEAMNLPIRKDREGSRLIASLCAPDKKSGKFKWCPYDFAALVEYCKRDVEVEREICNRLPQLSPQERAVWVADAEINARGILIDVPMVEKLSALVAHVAKGGRARMKELTGGTVKSATEVAGLRAFLLSEGMNLPDAKAKTIEAALIDAAELPAALLTLRKEASKASTGKLTAMVASAGADNRARGLLSYYGADTGRWAGRRIQTQNMPRTPKGYDPMALFEAAMLDTELADSLVSSHYGSTVEAVSHALRSLIRAECGHDLMACDYANIEGRVLAWQAGERWKLDAFRDYDTIVGKDDKGKAVRAGPDLYVLAYSKSFGIPIEAVDDSMRQIGKVQELALGYQGGLGAFAGMAANYGITTIADDAPRPATGSVLTHSEVERIKTGWRDAHPHVVALWRGLGDAAIEAVSHVGRRVDYGPISYRVVGPFLCCRLPSGRVLRYPYPIIVHAPSYGFRMACQDVAATVDATAPAEHYNRAKWLARVAERGRIEPLRAALVKFRDAAISPIATERASELLRDLSASLVPQVQCWGRGKKTYDENGKPKRAKWGPWSPYGGLLVENTTQAIARDLLAEAILRLEAHGYPVVMHVHDEIVCEVRETFGSVQEMSEIMCELPAWAAGLPIAAEGWRGPRYRK